MSFNFYDTSKSDDKQSHIASAHDMLKKAHHQMKDQFKKSWFYWPLAWTTSLGSELVYQQWQNFDLSNRIFAKRYLNSYSFIQWIFLSFLDKETKRNFERAMEIYAALFESNHETPEDFDLHKYPIDILNIEINRTLIRQMTDIDLRIYHTLNLKPQHVEKLLAIKKDEPYKYNQINSISDAMIDSHVSDDNENLLDADESSLDKILSQLNSNCQNHNTYQNITRNIHPIDVSDTKVTNTSPPILKPTNNKNSLKFKSKEMLKAPPPPPMASFKR